MAKDTDNAELHGHPLFDNPDAYAILGDLASAQNSEQWNQCIARLVAFLFVASYPPGEVTRVAANHLLYRELQVVALIERGPPTPANRPSHTLQARLDARNLELRAAPNMDAAVTALRLEKDTRPIPDFKTEEEIPLWLRARTENLRDRVERAEKAGNFKIPRRGKKIGL